VAFVIGFSFLLGILSTVFVKGEAVNYFVAGKSLPLWIVAMTLGAQSVDSNTVRIFVFFASFPLTLLVHGKPTNTPQLLGNVDLSYQFHVRFLACSRVVVVPSMDVTHDHQLTNFQLSP
jgi:hypothetical protein